MANPLYTWLKARKLWISDNDDHRHITHYFMDGGKCHVPDDVVEEFMQAYCNALREGHKQYLVESRTPLFKLFMDVDLHSKSPVSDDLVLRICKCVHAGSKEFFDPMESNFIICTCAERKIPETGLYKRGVHVHWTNVFVSSSKAMLFRNHVLQKCVDTFGECFATPWSKILDQTVYKSSGLRIIGSSKKDVPGEYMPWMVITKDDNLTSVERPEENMMQWVLATSIRTSSTRSIVADTTDAKGEERILKTEYKGDFSRLNPQEHNKMIDAVTMVIQTIRDKNGQSFYKRLRMTTLYKVKDGSHITYILGTTCKNCLNKSVSDSHRSNHVYFVVNESGIFQKCFCRCETTEGRKYMMCKDFKFKISDNISEDLYRMLFGKDKMERSRDMITRTDSMKYQLNKVMGRLGGK